MNKALILSLLLICGSVFGATVSERSFAESGQDGFSLDAARMSECMDYQFSIDQNHLIPGNYPILLINADFAPTASQDANVVVTINEDENGIVIPTSGFKNGWYHLDLNAQTAKPDNFVSICAQTSDSTTSIVIKDSSLFGVYKKPVFNENDFVKTLVDYSPLVGDEFSITISLHNSGSEPVDINVFYKKPYVPYDSILYVKGQTQYVGTIQPNETVTFSYIGKSTRSGMVTIPAAVVTYTTIFGEETTLVSNYPLIMIGDPEITIKGFVFNKSSEKNIFPLQDVALQLVIQNDGLNDLFNVGVALDENADLLFDPGTTRVIPLLKAGESKTIQLRVSAKTVGRYEIGCKLTYQDSNMRQAECAPTSLRVEEQPLQTELVAGVVLVFTAVLVFLYYHFRKV
ncbi:MAG: hypothetical protein J4215_06530 [Candidatus Diapherotrites archaeon]|uniref:CARDB domain-containing protein n=1 Tax=Candidatus Iainarchaeum sp. TaxID=3101447 RepID=A0A8T4L9I6_9ARCH|nr:hypothetical protein [Candidatus Diapherotrites archaeon]